MGILLMTIIADGFTIDHYVEHILHGDSPVDIAISMSMVALKFSRIWEKKKRIMILFSV